MCDHGGVLCGEYVCVIRRSSVRCEYVCVIMEGFCVV